MVKKNKFSCAMALEDIDCEKYL